MEKVYPKFSVLMSLYIKEKAIHFDECMKSLLAQTVLPDEIVIVLDGPITKEVRDVLDRYIKSYPGLINLVENEVNKGLGLALADGILACKNELVARMDTDDIAVSNRFEMQLKEFMNNPELTICGSDILEFEGDVNNVVARRHVPEDDESIKQYQKRRDSFNHMTVMYNKHDVLRAGNYQSVALMEDTVLWVNMIQGGAVCKNISIPLVYARVGAGMYNRRGGIDYLKKYIFGRKKVLETGYITKRDYALTILVQCVVALLPNSIRGQLFKKVLHK